MTIAKTEKIEEKINIVFDSGKAVIKPEFDKEVAKIADLAKAKNCAACHGQQLEGKDDYPRLAGQGYDYLVDQLTNFKTGKRHDATGAMAAMAGPLSQQDIEDLAQFIASR